MFPNMVNRATVYRTGVLVSLSCHYLQTKCLFLIDELVVWCPTWSKNLGRSLLHKEGFEIKLKVNTWWQTHIFDPKLHKEMDFRVKTSNYSRIIFFMNWYYDFKACYKPFHIGTLSHISNIAVKSSLEISLTVWFECNRTFILASWYVTSLCPNTIGFARFPNQMGEMTCILVKSLSIIVRTFTKERGTKKVINVLFTSYSISRSTYA